METNDLHRLTKIMGIIITVVLVLIFGSQLIGMVQEKGFNYTANHIGSDIFHWYDNPIPFLFTYIIGYIIVWRKILYGSIIIIAACFVSAIFNIHNYNWIFMFVLPPLIIGILYLVIWCRTKK